LQTQHYAQPAWNGENQKEGIIFLEYVPTGFMMVLVQVPQKTVHYIFVGSPGNGFHDGESAEGN
jgi:hypothetical protein